MSNPPPETIAYLGLGANLGDRLASLRAAIHALDQHDGIRVDWERGVAPVYETSPVGGPADQPPYLNSAIRIFTTLDPFVLLAATQHMETQLGRERHERWAARTIDIDILIFGDRAIESESLTIPHVRLQERLFVLAPLCDLALDLAHPRTGTTIREIATELETAESGQQKVRLIDPDWCHQPTAAAILESKRGSYGPPRLDT